MPFNSEISLHFRPSGLSTGQRGVVKPSAITEVGIICVLKSSSMLFVNLGEPEFGT